MNYYKNEQRFEIIKVGTINRYISYYRTVNKTHTAVVMKTHALCCTVKNTIIIYSLVIKVIYWQEKKSRIKKLLL